MAKGGRRSESIGYCGAGGAGAVRAAWHIPWLLPTLLSIGAYILAWLVAIVLLPVGSNAIRSNEKLFNTMLYYTEGSEYVGNVELSKRISTK